MTAEGRRHLVEAQRHLTEARTLRPAWSRVPLLAAEVFTLLGSEDQAIEQYLQAIQLGERNPRAIRRVVQLLTARQRYLEADRILRRVEEQQLPFSADLGRVAAEISLRLDDFDRALELARAAASESTDFRDHIWLGQVLGILGQRERDERRAAEGDSMWAEAEQHLQRAIELGGSTPEPWVALIQFLARSGQKPKAEQAIAQAESQIAAEQAPLALAQCFEAIAELERAEEKYRQAVDASPDNPHTIRQLAEFYLRNGKPAEAEQQLQKIVAGPLETAPADLVWGRRSLAMILGTRGGYASLTQGLELVDRNLATAEPAVQDQRTKALLLASHPRRRQREQAIEILEQVLRQQRVAAAEDRFILARLYLAQGGERWSQASRHFRTLLAAAPNEPRYIEAYAEALLGRNETAEAELWLNRLQQLAPVSFSTAALRARGLCQRGQHDAAIQLLNDFHQRFTSTDEERAMHAGPVAAALEQLAQQTPKPAQQLAADRLLAEAETLYRLHATAGADQQMLLAAFLARHRQLNEALEMAEAAVADCRPEILAGTIVDLLGRGVAPPDQRQRAENLVRGALQQHDRPTGLLLALADYCVFSGRGDEGEALYREVLERNPDQVLALNNLAVYLALRGKQLDHALRLVQRAIQLAGPSAPLLDSRAAVQLARGDFQAALKDMQEVLAESPTAAAHFRHAQILHRLGLKPAATRAFEDAQRLQLTAESLHPLERPAYEALRRALL